jgi:SSS family solute:Na+ symporter
MIGAILSSFNSALNSTCTLFSLGVYRNAINREAEGKTLVRASKYFGWIMAFITMSIAPLLAGQDSIFGYLQKMNGIYFIPLFAVILVGMLSKRIPAVAANWALPLGILVIAFGYFVPLGEGIYLTNYIHDFHFLGMVFLGLILFMILIGIMNPTEEFEQVDAKLVDLTPWRYAPHASAVLIFLVFTIYYSFSDFTLVVPFAYKPILAALILTLLVLRLRRKKAVMAN